ncbi:MAG: tetratricopeptide repeat protein [Pseudomonadota bacterium]
MTQSHDALASANTSLTAAWACFDEGRLEDAIRLTRQSIEHASENRPHAHAALGWFLLSAESVHEAQAILMSSLGRHPEYAPLHWYLGLVHLKEHRLEEASQALLAAVSFDPDLDEAAVSLAWVLGDLGRFGEAEHYARQALALKLQPDRVAQLGWFLLAQEKWAPAATQLAHALSLQPGNAETRGHLATALQRSGESDAALSLLNEGLVLSADNPALLLQRIRLLLDLGRGAEADDALRTAVGLDPASQAESYRQLGWVFVSSRRFADACTAFTTALEIQDKDAKSWYGLADAHRAMGQVPDALRAVDTALQLRDGWLDALVLRGHILLDQGASGWEEAVEQLKQALLLQPAKIETRCHLATALQRLKRGTEALKILCDGLVLAPQAMQLQQQHIHQLLHLRRTDDAHAACHRLLQQRPDDGMGWYLLSLVLVQYKRPGVALRALARARCLAPDAVELWQQTGWSALAAGDLRTAREAVARLQTLAPDEVTSNILAAVVLENSGDLQAASCHAEKSVAHAAQSAAAWRALAQVRARQDRLEEAAAALHTALDLDPHDTSDAYRQLGWVCIADHRLEDAITAFTAAVENQATDAGSWYGLAEANRANDRFVDALKAVKNTLGLREEWGDRSLRGQIIHELVYSFMNRNWHDLDAAPQPLPAPRPQPPAPSAPYDYVLCSLSTKSHLHLMRTLAASARKHFAGKIYLLVVDSDDASIVPEGTTLVRRNDVVDPAVWQDMVARYNILELCCALKSYLMRFLAKTVGCPIVYLDADTYLMGPLDRLLPATPDFSVFLTPHLFAPFSGERHADEVGMLAVGAYNGGMLAAGLHPDGLRFMDWWLERVTQYAYDSREQGVFTDQKWLDLVPSFFRNVHVSREPGLNVGHWRVCSEHDFAEDAEGRLTFLGEPVTLMHMSGFKPNRPDLLAQHIRPPVIQGSALGRFLQHYAREALGNKQTPHDHHQQLNGA